MITVRKSSDRGHFDFGWLDTHHTFSFGGYRDPKHVHFRALRVINEDRIAPGGGFPTHDHADMEIITYVVSGALAHKDSTGGQGAIRPGDVQAMSAGTGVFHSEFNGSKDGPVHLLQVWILPDKHGHTPRYDQKHFDEASRRGTLRLVVSPDGADASLAIHQDTRLYASLLPAGESVTHDIKPGRHVWVQVVKGTLDINGTPLSPGDGAAVSDERSLSIKAGNDAEFLLFDLA